MKIENSSEFLRRNFVYGPYAGDTSEGLDVGDTVTLNKS